MKKTVGFTLVALAILGLFCLATPILAAENVNMTGDWSMFVETPMGTGTPEFILKQEGDVLSGTYMGTFGEAPVTGKVTGNQFVIEFVSSDRKNVYTGTVEGDKCKGTLNIQGIGDGKFEGEKR